MNYQVRVTFPIEPILNEMEMISGDIMARTVEAAEKGAGLLAAKWKEFAGGGTMPDGQQSRASPELVKSIQATKISPFHWVVSSDHPDASKFENGSPEVDMKDLSGPWLTGKKTRVNGKWLPYLIIPFRHGVPGSINNPMPGAVYRAVLSQLREGFLTKSRVTRNAEQNAGIKEEPNIHGDMIPRASYNCWGGTFITVINSRQAIDLKKYEGMYAFDTSSGKQKRSSYITFRTLSSEADADKWIIKAKPGYNMLKQAADEVAPVIRGLIEEAIKIDLGAGE